MNDEDWLVRKYAVSALGRMGDKSVIPELEKALNDEDADVAQSAMWGLWEFAKDGDEAATRALQDALSNGDDHMRWAISNMLRGVIGVDVNDSFEMPMRWDVDLED